jgi:hypothetical protein
MLARLVPLADFDCDRLTHPTPHGVGGVGTGDGHVPEHRDAERVIDDNAVGARLCDAVAVPVEDSSVTVTAPAGADSATAPVAANASVPTMTTARCIVRPNPATFTPAVLDSRLCLLRLGTESRGRQPSTAPIGKHSVNAPLSGAAHPRCALSFLSAFTADVAESLTTMQVDPPTTHCA